MRDFSDDLAELRRRVEGARGYLNIDDARARIGELEVDKAHELAKVEVDKEQQLAAIEVTKEEKVAEIVVVKEEQVDVVKAKGDRRKRHLEILGLITSGIAGGAAVIELLHRIGVL